MACRDCCLMKSTALLREHVGDVFIVPAGRFAAGHVADAADAVDDRVVVSRPERFPS